MVHHRASCEALVAAVAQSINTAAQLLHTPRIVELELTGRSEGDGISPATNAVLNKMIKVLSACLSCLVCLAGPVTELLCPGSDEAAGHALFFLPSFHASSDEPSLAALTQVMDLHTTIAAKERVSGVSLAPCAVVACAEKASLLLVAQATLALLQLQDNPRDQTRLKMALQDEMNTFYSRWLGRKPSSSPQPASSVAPSSSSAGSATTAKLDLAFIRLTQDLVSKLVAVK